jgi:hypothetical protein
MKFWTNIICFNLNAGYDDKSIEEVETTKFLGLQIDNGLRLVSITSIKHNFY